MSTKPLTGFEISLAEWSLHRSIQSGRFANLDFPRLAREEFGLGAIELVNTLMEGSDPGFIFELRRRADESRVRTILIMCDDEGDLSALDAADRRAAVRNHHRWIDAARGLGCRAVRVNTGGEGRPVDGEAVDRCAESCRSLLDYAAPRGIEVLIENHGGISADADHILELVAKVNHPLFGTLPDFGNFPPGADRYRSIERLMPHARAVSAKCHDFDDATGDEITIDFPRMLEIVRRAGYRGSIGIEYEGDRLDEVEAIHRARRLLERLLGGSAIG